MNRNEKYHVRQGRKKNHKFLYHNYRLQFRFFYSLMFLRKRLQQRKTNIKFQQVTIIKLKFWPFVNKPEIF